MRLLLDACVWGGALEELRAAGHQVVWAGQWDESPSDAEILARAHGDSQVLVTLDKDFGELAVVRRQPHAGIVRLVHVSARRQGPVCSEVLARYADELQAGAILTVEPGRVRIRPGEET